MLISRRGFLKLIGAAIASGATVPAFAKSRTPYVTAGEMVSYIGRSPGGFCGDQLVHEVSQWDGVGYPVLCWNNSYGPRRALERYYDFELANFRREVPHDFWHHHGNVVRYPNVHTFVREQRFGETVIEAMRKLNFTSVKLPITA